MSFTNYKELHIMYLKMVVFDPDILPSHRIHSNYVFSTSKLLTHIITQVLFIEIVLITQTIPQFFVFYSIMYNNIEKYYI